MPASAGLRSLYRQIEAGEVDLADAPEPKRSDDLGSLGIWFGPQLGWSREREGGTIGVEWACDLATRETLIVEACVNCESGFGNIRLPHRVACAGCLRSSLDPRIKAILRDESR